MSTFWTAARNRITSAGNERRHDLLLFFGRPSACSLLSSSDPQLRRNSIMATEVTSPDQFKELLSKDLQRVSLLYFWAPWAEPCKQMTEVVNELSKKYPELLSLKIEAEDQSDISESFDVESVPSFIILRVRRTSIHLSRKILSLRLTFHHQFRVTLYLRASWALIPAPSPKPLGNMLAHKGLPRLSSPPRLLHQLRRKRIHKRSASTDS